MAVVGYIWLHYFPALMAEAMLRQPHKLHDFDRGQVYSAICLSLSPLYGFAFQNSLNRIPLYISLFFGFFALERMQMAGITAHPSGIEEYRATVPAQAGTSAPLLSAIAKVAPKRTP